MPAYVVFQLRAPLASFGLSSGDWRTSERYPTKSSVLGLVGAALGHDRSDSAGLRKLVATTHFAVLELKRAVPCIDFHTVQAPLAAPDAAEQLSRREQVDAIHQDLLMGGKYKNGKVTHREYLQDGHWLVALETDDAEQIAHALDAPAYPLYLGRKSCPLSAYCAPLVLHADDVAQALRTWLGQRLPDKQDVELICYWDDHIQSGDLTPRMGRRRNDVRTHSQLNHFRSRNEVQGSLRLASSVVSETRVP
jgi:CRISPR system Cascade subunit CasD